MGQQCAICKKKPVLGNQYVRSGKAKYLGGVGRKVRGISKRAFQPNLQRIQCQVGGSVRTLRVCVACIRSGRVQRPIKRAPFTMPAHL
jgi:large subunit ribosomal protein L28